MKDPVIVATRKSKLALAQSRAWMQTLRDRWPDLGVEELTVVTTGDRVQDRALSEIGGKGLFIKEIEEALLDGRAHIAVHSIKDVPAELAPGLVLACIPSREDPRDVLITKSGAGLAELPPGAKVGTSSLRRRVQLLRVRPDLDIQPLRGNVDTRLAKLERGDVDAIVLAFAGLRRLGLAERATEVLSPEVCLPAVGQGALGIEIKEDAAHVRELVAALEDPLTATAVAAERGVMRAVDGSCHLPVAAFATKRGDTMHLEGLLAEPDGSNLRQRRVEVPWPDNVTDAARIGDELGQALARG